MRAAAVRVPRVDVYHDRAQVRHLVKQVVAQRFYQLMAAGCRQVAIDVQVELGLQFVAQPAHADAIDGVHVGVFFDELRRLVLQLRQYVRVDGVHQPAPDHDRAVFDDEQDGEGNQPTD